jgi:hypothetical protein
LAKVISDSNLLDSQKYAQSAEYLKGVEYLRESTAPSIKPPTIDVSTSIQPATEIFIGVSTKKGTFALMPALPSMKTPNTAFQHNLADSVGPGDILKEKIEHAPSDLKSDLSYSQVNEFGSLHGELDKILTYVSGKTHEYTKG